MKINGLNTYIPKTSSKDYAQMLKDYDSILGDCPFPYETLRMNTQFGDTHAIVSGPADGLPIILLHNWGNSAAGFYIEFPFLIEDYRVYAIDVVGQTGKSATISLNTRDDSYAKWLIDVLDELQISQCIFVGISGGGWLTMKLAVYASYRISKAVVLSTLGIVPFKLEYLFNLINVGLFPSNAAVRNFVQFLTSPFVLHGKVFDTFCSALLPAIKYYRPLTIPRLLSTNELGKITSPMLFLMGEYDRVFNPLKAIAQAKKTIPSLVAAELIPRAGHAMTIDQPKLLKDRVLTYLENGL